MPSPDILMAEVLETKCFSLQHRVDQGLFNHHGQMHVEGIPFVWSLDWETKEGNILFHLQVWHVRPRSLKQIVNKHLPPMPEGEIL